MQIWQTPHWNLERVTGSLVVRLRRTGERIEDLAAFESAFDEYEHALPYAQRAELSLLIDLRNGPLNNDPRFEEIFRRRQRQVFGGFRRFALLVRTSVGKLQVTRQARELGRATPIYQDEKEALAYLLGR